jgi:hypothetical protein
LKKANGTLSTKLHPDKSIKATKEVQVLNEEKMKHINSAKTFLTASGFAEPHSPWRANSFKVGYDGVKKWIRQKVVHKENKNDRDIVVLIILDILKDRNFQAIEHSMDCVKIQEQPNQLIHLI